jgi:hypothetical protein
MHFHLPRPLHGWRAFVGEVGIIVLGVLIALSCEQLVQEWQWRQRIATAERGMRGELLGDDGPQVYQRAAMHPCVQQRLDQIRAAVENLRSRGEISSLVNSFQLQIHSYDNIGQQQAEASQASEHMRPEVASLYAKAYSAVPLMDRTNSEEAVELGRLHAFRRTGGPVSDAESIQLLQAVEALRTDDLIMWQEARWEFPLLRQIGKGRPSAGRTDELMRIARGYYGDCVKPLPADFPKATPDG